MKFFFILLLFIPLNLISNEIRDDFMGDNRNQKETNEVITGKALNCNVNKNEFVIIFKGREASVFANLKNLEHAENNHHYKGWIQYIYNFDLKTSISLIYLKPQKSGMIKLRDHGFPIHKGKFRAKGYHSKSQPFIKYIDRQNLKILIFIDTRSDKHFQKGKCKILTIDEAKTRQNKLMTSYDEHLANILEQWEIQNEVQKQKDKELIENQEL